MTSHHRLAPPLHLRSFDSAFCSINYIGLKKEYLTAPPAKPYFHTKTTNFIPNSTYIYQLHLLAPPSNFGVRVMMVRVRVKVDFRLWSHVWDKLCNTFISLRLCVCVYAFMCLWVCGCDWNKERHLLKTYLHYNQLFKYHCMSSLYELWEWDEIIHANCLYI